MKPSCSTSRPHQEFDCRSRQPNQSAQEDEAAAQGATVLRPRKTAQGFEASAQQAMRPAARLQQTEIQENCGLIVARPSVKRIAVQWSLAQAFPFPVQGRAANIVGSKGEPNIV
ncbi:hypothetical protein Salat_0845900 [Sesamum alatum]|uniref:Uncharacterized protein n=1 Tax=Sesamum alatum TaxID=300844 RepID=A0AAE1YIR0_9LAMI|nr:hypothetical protein Salat_0845900 [Sesamum alatum]